MSTPKQTTDPKEAALLVILDRLEAIDDTPGTRGGFCAQVIMNSMHQFDQPIFKHEIDLIRATLGLEPKDKPQEGEVVTIAEVKKPTVNLEEL